ncbi:hypothetical protein KEM54_000934 [Ascosphaera aggregata]|nr:hypothetical protein KEM54_000934 [Ascosphaera aggregata]
MYQRGFLFDVVRNHTRNDQHCDLKIICGDDVYNVHRFILYFQSDFFAKESPKQELSLSESSVLIDQMIKFFYEGSYSSNLPPTLLSRWIDDRITAGGKVLSSSSSEDTRLSTAIFHLSMYALATRLSVAGLKEEALAETVKSIKDLTTLEILEHVIPEVYSTVSLDGGDSSSSSSSSSSSPSSSSSSSTITTTTTATDDNERIRKAVTAVLMDKLIYQSPAEQKTKISSVNEAMVDEFPLYAKELEERVLDRENEISEMHRAEVGLR